MTKRGHCSSCGTETNFRHRHDTAYGLAGTHMVGTERFECQTCGKAYYATDGAPPPLKFILDKEPNQK